MKTRKFFLFGMAALLSLGLVLAGCDNPTSSGGGGDGGGDGGSSATNTTTLYKATVIYVKTEQVDFTQPPFPQPITKKLTREETLQLWAYVKSIQDPYKSAEHESNMTYADVEKLFLESQLTTDQRNEALAVLKSTGVVILYGLNGSHTTFLLIEKQ